MPDRQRTAVAAPPPGPFLCLYHGHMDECLNCGGWAGPMPLVVDHGPGAGRFCTGDCADEARDFALRDIARFAALRAEEEAAHAAYVAAHPEYQAELDAWNARTDVEWAIPYA